MIGISEQSLSVLLEIGKRIFDRTKTRFRETKRILTGRARRGPAPKRVVEESKGRDERVLPEERSDTAVRTGIDWHRARDRVVAARARYIDLARPFPIVRERP